MDRSERRHQNKRIKAKVHRRGLYSLFAREQLTPAWIGKTAATHWTCSCWQCKAPNNYRKPVFEYVNQTKFFE